MSEPTTMPSHLRAGTPLAYAGVGLALLAAVAAFSSSRPADAILIVLLKLIQALWPAAVYLAGAFGLGRLARPAFRGARDEVLLQLGAGLALMLTVSHVLGQAGLVSGTAGLAAAWAPVGLGLLLVARQVADWSKAAGDLATDARRWGILDWAPLMLGAAIMIIAACSPPGGLAGRDFGGLWRSEFGGFDAISYHLPLPQEWLAAGRLTPLDHNIYSYLPGYMEAAFLHTAVLSGGGRVAGGMLADEGWRLLTCQFLHAGMGGLTAIGVYRLVRVWAPGSAVSARFAASLVIATPWTIVVGSLAYNELAVTALSAPLLVAAWDDRLTPLRRGVLCGLLLSAAASAKPPAAFLLGAPAAVLLLTSIPPRRWPAAALGGVIAGVVIAAPWLIRNWQACGNPIFPYAHGLLGSGSWEPGQFERYAASHRESAPFLERLAMVFIAPAGSAQARGVLHPQWAVFFPLGGILGVFALRGEARRLAAGLAGGAVLSLVLWLALTHVQSRFLMPLLVPIAALAALGLARLPIGEGARRAPALIAAGAQAVAASVIFAGQCRGEPGASLPWMPAAAAGESLRAQLKTLPTPERLRFLTAEASPLLYINLGLPPSSTVYLIGDATPLYYTVPVLYNTVYDRWPLLEAMRRSPGSPDEKGGQWIADLRAGGVTHVLVDLPEIARYRASGYSDPAMTPEAILKVFSGRAALVRAWTDPTNTPVILLFELTPAKSGLAAGVR